MTTSLFRLWNIFKIGAKAIARNKMRSSLTMLGIIIGVGCVIAMIGVSGGASASVQQSIGALGSNFIMIHPGASTQSGARIFTGQSSITEDDVEAIRNECPAVAYTSPGVRTGGQVVAGELNWGSTVYGVGVDWPFIRAWNVDQGAFFTEGDVRSAIKVCILGTTVAENLFPDGSAVGSIVRIKNVPFRVVGVLEKKGGNMMGQDQDDQIIVPYTTAMKRLIGSPRLQLIYVSARSQGQVDDAVQQIQSLLRQRHRIQPGQDDDFMIRSQEEIASMAAQTSKTLSLLLGSVALISLIVGGIGIMNIMLVSVTERTREIGVRMAVGAKGRHVLTQFLLESITLSVLGGALGVGLGLGVLRLISRFAQWPVHVAPAAIALAFGFAAFVGIFFGWYPARKASRLDPIEALRYE